MDHFVYEGNADTYPIALLVKDSAFNAESIDRYYVRYLVQKGVPREDILVVSLPYQPGNKATASFMKEQLETIMNGLLAAGTKHVFCLDAPYFKTLTKVSKADPHYGYPVSCKWPDCEHMNIIIGLNYRQLAYRPDEEPKLYMGLDTLADVVFNRYTTLGKGIIHSATYPKQLADIQATLKSLHQYDELTADIEAFSLDFQSAGIGTIGFAWSRHEGAAFACDYQPSSSGGDFVPNPDVRAALREFLETYQGKLIWHRAQYDLKAIIYALWMDNDLDTNGMLKGIEIMTRHFEDTLVILYLATNSVAGNELGLKAAAHAFAGNYAVDVKDIKKVELPNLLEYNLIDCLSTYYLYETHYPTLVKENLEELYLGLMKDSIKTLIQMELVGMPLKPTQVNKVDQKISRIAEDAKAAIAQSPFVTKVETILQTDAMVAANAKLKTKQHPIERFHHLHYNPNSAQQTAKLLYDICGLPVIDRTKKGQPSTGTETLKKLVNHTDDQNILDLLQNLNDYSEAEKIRSSFVPAFQRARVKADGRSYLHGNFNIGGTISGRLSSSNPNLQNLPSGSTFGKLIKSCFQAPPGWIFCGADFASLEDRINALVTQDPNKLKVYLDGFDGHSLRTVSYWPDQFPGIDINDPASVNTIADTHDDLRSKSKGPTFALTYQGTWSTLVNKSGFSPSEAKDIEARYHELYEVSTNWVHEQIALASDRGYALGAFGIRIRTPLLEKTVLNTKNTPNEAKAEARSLGNAISGQSYGLLTNRAMNATMARVWASEHRFNILPVAMIHDANYFLVKDNVKTVEWLNRVLIEEMAWQELPEICHDIVKLEAELDLFWPSWANSITLPNNATAKQIQQICSDVKEKTDDSL